MRKVFLALAALAAIFALPASAIAQTRTSVTGTVTGTDGIAWNGGSITATIVSGGGASFSLTPCSSGAGCPISPTTSPTGIGASGAFSMSPWANASILPAGTTYTFTATINPGLPPPIGTGPQTCTVAGVTVAGATQTVNLTGCPALTNVSAGSSGVTAVTATAPVTSSGGATPNIACPTCLAGVSSPDTVVFVSPNCGGVINCFPVNDDTQVVWNSATYSSGSPNIACPACTFVSGDVGKIFFATNVLYPGFTSQLTSIVTCPQTTIKTITDSHDIILNANCTSSSVIDTPIVWGSDDTSNLTAAWAATVAACTTLQLPGINAQGNGPAAMLVQSAEFDTAAGTPTKANCGIGAEAQRSGIGLHGVDISASYIIPTPSFDFTSCTWGYSGAACFVSVNDGLNATDFSIWGVGVSNPSGATSKVIMDVDGAVSVTPTTGNNTLSRINIMGWGAGSSGIGTGLLLEGGALLCNSVNVDGAGMNAVKVTGSGTAQACSLLNAFDTWSNTLVVTGGANFSTFGGSFGVIGATNGCGVDVAGSSTWSSHGDFIGAATVSSVNNGLCVAGTARLFGSQAVMGNAVGTAAYVSASGGKLYSQDSTFSISGTGSTAVYNTGSYFDLGGNVISGPTNYTCSTCTGLFGSASITGTAQTATNITPSTGWGTSGAAGNGVSAVSGSSQLMQFTITAAGVPTLNPTVAVVFPVPFSGGADLFGGDRWLDRLAYFRIAYHFGDHRHGINAHGQRHAHIGANLSDPSGMQKPMRRAWLALPLLAIALGLCCVGTQAQAMPSPWSEIVGITPSTTTTYTDSSVADGADYIYAVTAYSAADGESPIVEHACVAIPASGMHSVALAWNWAQGERRGRWIFRIPLAGGRLRNHRPGRHRRDDLKEETMRMMRRIPWLLIAVCAFCLFVPSLHRRGIEAQGTQHGVTLTWTAPPVTATNGPATSYNVLRGTATGAETQLATVPAPALTYLDTTGVQGTKYFYTVTATNAAGTSAPSNEASATFLVTGLRGSGLGGCHT